jgi:hypothetical protein
MKTAVLFRVFERIGTDGFFGSDSFGAKEPEPVDSLEIQRPAQHFWPSLHEAYEE